jgi:hypothetical protein
MKKAVEGSMEHLLVDILLGITIQLDQKRVKFTLPDFQRLFYLCYAVYNLNRTSGWAPQSFTSSRQNRAGARKQSISDFLDEDEKADMEGKSLSASSQFDTFGFTAAEHSRKHAEKEQHERSVYLSVVCFL